VLDLSESKASGLVDLAGDPVSFGVGVVGDQEPREPTAGDTHGNLRLVEAIDPARLLGTWEPITRQFPYCGPPWLVECVGCGTRIVTTPRWAGRGFVQCDSWRPQCRDAARRPGYPSADADEAALAPGQSAEWSRMIFPPHDDLRSRLALMAERVRR
jgi:hypothetical protein